NRTRQITSRIRRLASSPGRIYIASTSMSVSELLAAAYLEHRASVYAICLNRLGSVADAEDATQEVFLRVAPRLDDLAGDIGAYLRTIALNLCRDRMRRRPSPQ